jgi:hypothetical protein
MAIYGLSGFAGIFFALKFYRSFQPRKSVTYESKEEENYVKRYIEHTKKEAHKPTLLRDPYGGPSGLN